MKKLFVLAAVVVAVLVAVTPALAKPPSGGKGKSNNASLLLVSKDADWDVVWPGAFGQLKYELANPGGFQARLTLHGLASDTWYLVTLQEPPGVDDDSDNQFAGSDCLFGAKSDSGLEGFCDVALVRTNADGDSNDVIPTTSGLTASDLLVGALGSGSLADGTYTGLTVVVKNVGCEDEDAACSIPDVGPDGALIAGGTPELFEYQAMETFTVGS